MRGHLLLEQALTTIIDLQGERAKVVLDRASFASKLNVCDGLGLIDEELAEAVREVNRERNHLAHRLDALSTLERVSALIGRLPGRIRVAVNDVVSATPGDLAEEVPRPAASAKEPGSENPRLETLEVRFAHGARTASMLNAVFLVLAMGLGGVIQRMRYEAAHREKVESYKLACAIAEVQETGATPESIRAHLSLPDPPDPRDALGELFNTP